MRPATPSPVRTRRVLTYQVPTETELSLKVYTIAGRVVSTFVQGSRKPGRYRLAWDCTDNRQRKLAAGVYFLVLDAGNKRINRKVVLTGAR